MASESDSLRASSTTGETFTPLTSSTSDDSGAATASGVHRVGMIRQSAAASVPVQPSLNITIDLHECRYPPANTTVKNRTTGGDTSQSPKRDREEFKPTAARDENGFLIYYDATLSTKWRSLKSGQVVKTPLEHREGGKYFMLPLPPGYSAREQREKLKKSQLWANQKATLKSMKKNEIKSDRVYSEPVIDTAMSPASSSGYATAALPVRGRPPLTPRKGRSVERRVSKSPSNGPLKQTKPVSVERLLGEMRDMNTTTVSKLKKYRSASWGTETTRISTILSGDDQRRVDAVFARTTFEGHGFVEMQDEGKISYATADQLEKCYTELSNYKMEVHLLESSLRNASSTNTELHTTIRGNLESSQAHLSMLHGRLSQESDTARQLPVALDRIFELESQLQGVGHGHQDIEMHDALETALIDAALTNAAVTNTVNRVERISEDAAARQVGRAESEISKLRLSNDNLLRQLGEENAHRLADIANVGLERAELNAKIADLELSLKSRRLSREQQSSFAEELDESRKIVNVMADEVDEYKQFLENNHSMIHELECEEQNAVDELQAEKTKVTELELTMRDRNKLEIFSMNRQDSDGNLETTTELKSELAESTDKKIEVIALLEDWKTAYRQLQKDQKDWEIGWYDEEACVETCRVEVAEQLHELGVQDAVLISLRAHIDNVGDPGQNYQDPSFQRTQAFKFQSELVDARREVSVLKADVVRMTDSKKVEIDTLRNDIFRLQANNNKLLLDIAERREVERSSSSWSNVDPLTPPKGEVTQPNNLSIQDQTYESENRAAIPSSEFEAQAAGFELVDTPDRISESSPEFALLEKFEQKMQEKFVESEQIARDAVRRSEASEEALLKKSRSVDFRREEVKEVQTTLLTAAKAGDTTIEVDSNEDFPIGCQVCIGNMYRSEVRTVVGHGSLILQTPLRYHHEAGAGVYLFQSDYNRPNDEYYEEWNEEEDQDDNNININFGTGDARQSTPNQSDFEESDTSRGSGGKINVSGGGGQSYSKLNLKFKFPKVYQEIDDYHERFGEEILRISSRSDDKEKQFYDKIRLINDLEKPLVWLDRVPKRYVRLDREVRLKLEDAVRERTDLVNIIQRLRTDHRARRVPLTSRRMLVAFYASLAINSTIFEVVGLKSLTSLEYFGDNRAEEFYTEFQKKYSMMHRTEGALTDHQVRDLLHNELQKSLGPGSIELDLRDWEKSHTKNERTLYNLLQCYREWMARKKLRENSAASLQQGHHKNKNTPDYTRMSRSATRRLRAHALVEAKGKGGGDYSKGKGGKDTKGKGKDTSKGKGKGREEKGGKPPKGKGKGKNDSGKANQFHQPQNTPPPPQVHTPRNTVDRDVNGVPIAKHDDHGNRLNLCWWFQTEHNGGHRCPRKQNECMYIHAKCKYGEFPFITQPRSRSSTPAPAPDGKGKTKTKAKPKGKSRPNSPSPKKQP